MNEVMIYL